MPAAAENHSHRVKVFLTIDTEVWNFYDDLDMNHASAIYGTTDEGDFGLNYQLDIFNQYGLKAVYFVEPLFTMAMGREPLEAIVASINGAGQEIGLHLHTEWLGRTTNDLLASGNTGSNMKDFSMPEQSLLIKTGLEILGKAGAENIVSFRAGNYGGNLATLHALNENNIRFDTTYNYAYLNDPCEMELEAPLYQPRVVNDVYEFPITFYSDYPGHSRHLQLTACSFAEIKNILLKSWHQQRYSCVLVLHTFEWIRRINNGDHRSHKLDKVCHQRFLKLCRFLADHTDKFETVGFTDINEEEIPDSNQVGHLSSNPITTLARYVIQARRRFG